MDMSAWGRGGEDLFGEKCFRKTNKLQTSNVCARLRDADVSGQKHFWPKKQTPPKLHFASFKFQQNFRCCRRCHFSLKTYKHKGHLM
ncbi:hypothetical protein Hanom_Chr10g00954721 [Helianthus anomalus]